MARASARLGTVSGVTFSVGSPPRLFGAASTPAVAPLGRLDLDRVCIVVPRVVVDLAARAPRPGVLTSSSRLDGVERGDDVASHLADGRVGIEQFDADTVGGHGHDDQTAAGGVADHMAAFKPFNVVVIVTGGGFTIRRSGPLGRFGAGMRARSSCPGPGLFTRRPGHFM